MVNNRERQYIIIIMVIKQGSNDDPIVLIIGLWQGHMLASCALLATNLKTERLYMAFCNERFKGLYFILSYRVIMVL